MNFLETFEKYQALFLDECAVELYCEYREADEAQKDNLSIELALILACDYWLKKTNFTDVELQAIVEQKKKLGV